MTRVTTLATLFVLLAGAASPQTPPVQLQFQDGRVTLRAQNAPVRAILAEWARLGGATIVNGDRVTGTPLTIELSGVPERQALDIVLRTVAGYMLAPRRAGATGASAFDRIMILPTSVAPRNPPPAPAAAARPSPVLPRPPALARPPAPAAVVAMPDGGPPAEDAAGLVDDPGIDQTPATDTVVVPPPQQPRVMPRPLPRSPVVAQPVGLPQPLGGAGTELVPDQPDPEVTTPGTRPAVAPTPTNPFGIPAGSSTMPGVISPAPRPQQPQQQDQ